LITPIRSGRSFPPFLIYSPALASQFIRRIQTDCPYFLSPCGRFKPGLLFGSYVKGGLKSDSDIDLFIIGAPKEDDVFNAVRKVEDSVGREINYHLADEAEFSEKSRRNPFYREILKGPLMLIGKEDELKEIIGKA
jgi:predicted nucleotidyltransferase